MTFNNWIADRFGTRNWVVARRTANILSRYGDDVTTFTPAQFAKLTAEYECAARLDAARGFLRAAGLPRLEADTVAALDDETILGLFAAMREAA